MTVKRERSPFRPGGVGYYAAPTAMGDTLEVLERELRMLRAKNTELLMALRPEDFRMDGKPRASASPEHPGVVLSFDSKHGHLSYPCDTFTTWQANLRAIAFALEALRKVDRYGVTSHGEQYRGFLALEATAMPSGFTTADGAAEWLNDEFGEPGTVHTYSELLRRAQRATHPDMGGDPARFQRVSLAEAKLREAGRL
jgi:hypothetical protein